MKHHVHTMLICCLAPTIHTCTLYNGRAASNFHFTAESQHVKAFGRNNVQQHMQFTILLCTILTYIL